MPASDRSAAARNPYLNRVMIRDVADFYGRRREVTKIFARIGASRPQSVSIVGERRVGKSSLLNYLYHPEIRRRHLDEPDAYIFVLIDLQERREIGIPAFFEHLFSGIEGALGQARPSGLPADYEGARRVLVGLQEQQRKIILLFDEFDAVTCNPNFPEEFFSFLRSVANKYDVAYVTTSRLDLQQLCHADRIADSPFFNIFSNLLLTRFELDEALALIREPSQSAGIPLAPYVTDITDLAGLFPFFIQIACSAFFEQLAEGGGVDLEHVRASFLDEAEPHFKYICDHLDDDQRAVLRDVVEGRPVPPSLSYLMTRLRRDGYLLQEDGRERVFSSVFGRCVVEGRLTRQAGASTSGQWKRVEDQYHAAPGSRPTPFGEGRQVGAYRILSLLGSGGMGEVFRARDTRLERDVAIKIVPMVFSADTDRMARFEREARVLAALNHPHIGAIYGLEEIDGVRALVLELVEGSTLADRIAGAPLPIREALAIARQIASALEAAHAKRIIHRDLKPANIKVTPDGVVKVLDFGLAKVVAGIEPAIDLSQLPTITAAGTRPGVFLGTAAYMSPEQARGQSLDERTDIWSFGCVLYEMLTGGAAFAGKTLSDILAGILEREPQWQRLPPSTPARVAALVRRCLQKDPNQRLDHIAEVRIEIERALAGLPERGRVRAVLARVFRLGARGIV